ncbi:MAG TPA: lytic murein transglycosylase, partial [Synechococcales bacterium UBA8647]|nr:lytic murein transglycosylase [Synechococcales bacterium UBA8647]
MRRGRQRVLELDQVAYHPAAAEAAILSGVSLKLAAGRPALVVGRSGSGKTT